MMAVSQDGAQALSQMVTISTKGRQPLRFKRGALHAELGVPAGEKIPAQKMQQAAAGAYGPLAQQRARFARTALAAGRQTLRLRAKKG